MKTILKSKDLEEQTIIIQYPHEFRAEEGLLERVYYNDSKFARGFNNETILDGIRIQHRDILHEQPVSIEVQHDFPFFKMHFELKGHSSFGQNGGGCLPVDIADGHHRIFYFPEVKGLLYYPERHRYTMEINLSLPFLQKLFGEEMIPLRELATGICEERPVVMGQQGLPILPHMKTVIYEIIQCPYAGLLKKVYLEAKVAELLVMQLEQYGNLPEKENKTVLRAGDEERFRYVQELISKNIQEPCSLLELAQKAGLNEFKLKKGFKELFGNTVFGYMTDLRMEKARNLLLESRLSIAEISFIVGYKNPQHFTAAFKRKFGFLPRELKV